MSDDYSSMSDRELRHYMLKHRHNDEAFYAYMDRRNARPDRRAISLDNPEGEVELDAVIRQQIDAGLPPRKVGARNLNYDRYKGYAIAIQKIKIVNEPCKYLAKPLKVGLEQQHLNWESGQAEVYGKDINDAVRRCKEEIDKLVEQAENN